jgi:hypothetical protein
MNTDYSGSCLCGKVRFEIKGELESFYLCHCEYCRKDTGSAHAANLFSSTANLLWTAGEEKVSHFQLPGTLHAKSFCSICGSALPKLQMDGKLLAVPAGSLNSHVHTKPTAHIFGASRANWDHGLEKVPTFERLPG